MVKTNHLLIFACYYSYITGLSIDITPTPIAIVNVGENLTISTIVTISTKPWYSFFYSINNIICFTTFWTNSSNCNYSFDRCQEYEFTCNFTHLILSVAKVTPKLNGTTVYGQVSPDGKSSQRSNTTTIVVYVPLRNVLLTPIGILTITESVTQIFECSAISIPVANITWKFDAPSFEQASFITNKNSSVSISEFNYTMHKEDDGKRVSCTAGNDLSSATAITLLNVQYRPTVTIYPNTTMNTLLEDATNFQLTCTVIDGNPIDSTYRWFRNGSLISTTAIFTISKVKIGDAGSYTCDSSNIIGVSDQSAEIYLNVLSCSCQEACDLKIVTGILIAGGTTLVLGLIILFVAAILIIRTNRHRKIKDRHSLPTDDQGYLNPFLDILVRPVSNASYHSTLHQQHEVITEGDVVGANDNRTSRSIYDEIGSDNIKRSTVIAESSSDPVTETYERIEPIPRTETNTYEHLYKESTELNAPS